MNGAAALLVLRLVLPICDAGPEPDVRAEVYVVCPSCPQRTWVVEQAERLSDGHRVARHHLERPVRDGRFQ